VRRSVAPVGFNAQNTPIGRTLLLAGVPDQCVVFFAFCGAWAIADSVFFSIFAAEPIYVTVSAFDWQH